MTETLQKQHDESESESEEEIQTVTIDATKLTPLSPEVISKQVRSYPRFYYGTTRYTK